MHVPFIKGTAGLEFDFIVYNDRGRLKESTKWNANFHAPCSFVGFLIESVSDANSEIKYEESPSFLALHSVQDIGFRLKRVVSFTDRLF